MPKAPHAICDKCPFQDRPFAATTGPANASIAVISRAPGQYEALNGKSFSGPSGKVLNHLLELQGVSRDDVLATNVVLCQSDGSEPGFGLAVSCCDGRLQAEVENCDTIIACGTEAAFSQIGESSIARNRGYTHSVLHPISNKRQRVIVTNNPAMVLRDDGTFPELVRDFRLAINPLPLPKLPQVKWIEDINEAKNAAEEMIGHIEVMSGSFYQDGNEPLKMACDIETRGSNGESGLSQFAELVCVGFATRAERAVVFGEAPCYDRTFVQEYLRKLFEIEGISYLWHNGKYDVKVLRNLGIAARVDEDSMLLSWALDERPGNPESGAGGHSLEWLLKDHLGWPRYEDQSVRDFKKTGLLPDKRSRINLYEYNGYDTAGALSLFDLLKREAVNDNVWDKPYKSRLIRYSEMFTKIEMYGNLYDAERACDILEEEVYPKLIEYKSEARRLADKPILNPNSPKQLCTLLYDEWGVKHKLVRPKIERKGKRSTDKAVREEITRGDFTCNTTVVHPSKVVAFAKALNSFKEFDTQRGTFLEGMVLKRNRNGRIYTDFKIHGTESGRVSSSNPNLQNITRTKDGLPNIRSCFIPDPGCVFISADLSQAELRTISVLSGAESLQSIYLETGRSLHKETATEFYGENYTYEQYVRSKNINFGVVYWQSAYTFAQMYHMPQEEAQAYIDWWWARFPEVYAWTKEIEQQVLTNGELQSPFGHKRRFYVIPADDSGRQHIVKEGINFQPQNIAANITLEALAQLTEGLLDPEIAQPRITVHDSILVNCRADRIGEVAHLLKSTLEKAPKDALGWDFPFLADITVGDNWGNLAEYTLLPKKVATTNASK